MMIHRFGTWRHCRWAWLLRALVAIPLIASIGCETFQSHIDPTGQHIFRHPGDPAPVAAPLAPPAVVGVPAAPAAAVPPLPALAGSQPGVTVSPNQVIAPVGSEVIMIASVCGSDGYMVTGERVEWLLPPGEMGEFVGLGERGPFDFVNRVRGLPRKLNNTYVINTTASAPIKLDRGTPTPLDDVTIQSGQAWVSVTAGREGTSHVTAYVPAIPAWDRRQQTATIYWIDAQWTFPPPAINPVGSRHTFTTLVTRQTDGSPVAGWIVRYEMAGGPEAGFAPDGAPVAEVPTNEFGQASIEIFQKGRTAGSNQVAIQVIRPPDGVLGGGKRLIVGSGTTTKTWTSSDLAIRTRGPAVATVGSVVTYRIEVTNPAGVPAKDVVVTDDPPAGLSYLNSNPAANASPSGQEWRLGDLGPGQARVMEANFRVMRPGNFNYCASATGAEGLAAKDCATTNVSDAAPLIGVAVTGPPTAKVGDQVTFVVTVTNRGQAAASGLTIADRFDPGLQHSAAINRIERDLPDLAPGQSQAIGVKFGVTQPGQLCQDIEIRSSAGVLASAHSCLSAVAVAAVPAPPLAAPPTTPPALPPATVPRTPEPSRKTSFTVKKTGPGRRKVKEIAEFLIEVTNTGTTPLKNVRIVDNYDPSLEPEEATDGYDKDAVRTGVILWTVESLAPGARIRRQVNCRCLQATNAACNRVAVSTADGGTQADEACLTVEEQGPAKRERAGEQGGQLSLSVADEVDPVKVGGQTNYQIVLTNKGPASAKQVVVAATIPPGMTFVGSQGPTKPEPIANGVRFQPLAELRAGETVTFEVRVRAKTSGTAQFHVDVTSQGQQKPLSADETTEVLEQ